MCKYLKGSICAFEGRCSRKILGGCNSAGLAPLPTSMPPSGIDAWTAIQEQGVSREEFLTWEFRGYDDCGMQVRMPPPGIIIVTRHKGAIEWLRQQGIEGKAISHATADDVRCRKVYGNLPLHLAAEAASVTIISLPDLKPEQRGKDLSPDEMYAAGAHLESFEVRRI